MKERNEVSDSGDACDVYLAEDGLPREAMRPPDCRGARPEERKIESPINDEWVNGWDKERKTNRCQASLPAA